MYQRSQDLRGRQLDPGDRRPAGLVVHTTIALPCLANLLGLQMRNPYGAVYRPDTDRTVPVSQDAAGIASHVIFLVHAIEIASPAEQRAEYAGNAVRCTNLP